jgi:hypothetical protein
MSWFPRRPRIFCGLVLRGAEGTHTGAHLHEGWAPALFPTTPTGWFPFPTRLGAATVGCAMWAHGRTRRTLIAPIRDAQNAPPVRSRWGVSLSAHGRLAVEPSSADDRGPHRLPSKRARWGPSRIMITLVGAANPHTSGPTGTSTRGVEERGPPRHPHTAGRRPRFKSGPHGCSVPRTSPHRDRRTTHQHRAQRHHTPQEHRQQQHPHRRTPHILNRSPGSTPHPHHHHLPTKMGAYPPRQAPAISHGKDRAHHHAAWARQYRPPGMAVARMIDQIHRRSQCGTFVELWNHRHVELETPRTRVTPFISISYVFAGQDNPRQIFIIDDDEVELFP